MDLRFRSGQDRGEDELHQHVWEGGWAVNIGAIIGSLLASSFGAVSTHSGSALLCPPFRLVVPIPA